MFSLTHYLDIFLDMYIQSRGLLGSTCPVSHGHKWITVLFYFNIILGANILYGRLVFVDVAVVFGNVYSLIQIH